MDTFTYDWKSKIQDLNQARRQPALNALQMAKQYAQHHVPTPAQQKPVEVITKPQEKKKATPEKSAEKKEAKQKTQEEKIAKKKTEPEELKIEIPLLSGRAKDNPIVYGIRDLLGMTDADFENDQNVLMDIANALRRQIKTVDDTKILKAVAKLTHTIPGDKKHRTLRRLLMLM